MKKFNTNRLRAFFMALLLVLTSTAHTSAFAKSDVTWTEDDFMYSSEGNIIAFSDKGLEKKEKRRNWNRTSVISRGTRRNRKFRGHQGISK